MSKARKESLSNFFKTFGEPSVLTGNHKDVAILRLQTAYGFIEYPRKEFQKVLDEVYHRIVVCHAGLDEPTATDKFLEVVIKAMAGRLKEDLTTMGK